MLFAYIISVVPEKKHAKFNTRKMDKLDPTQRTAVSKMSTERLRIKFGKVDFDEQLVSEMTRELLLKAWANCVLSGKDKPELNVI